MADFLLKSKAINSLKVRMAFAYIYDVYLQVADF